VAKTGKNQLYTYLDEPTLDIHFSVAIDVLEWWKSNNERFPDLALMARDLLSILITIVASESAFSIGSRILNKYRNCLLSTSVEAIICTCSWKHGFCDGKLFIIELSFHCKASSLIELPFFNRSWIEFRFVGLESDYWNVNFE